MSNPLCVLQITDSHLYSDPTTVKNGINPHGSLESVLSSALLEHAVDAIIHTGDMAHEAVESTYLSFLKMLRNHSLAPLICTPGNHDLTDPFNSVCPTNDLVLGEWLITSVDSHTDQEVAGHLTMPDIQTLEEKLTQSKHYSLIATHHPPHPIGVTWLDGHRIDNGQELLDLCARNQQVRALVCGHVHQASEKSYDSLEVMTTPSTCWQFGEQSASFQLSDRSPGWRWIFLHDTGTITTEVGRLAN